MLNPFRRSLLYVPGDQKKMLDKIDSRECDSIIIDLEDAVAPAHKCQARENAREYLLNKTSDRETFVRVNDVFSSYFLEDVKMAVGAGADGIVLPKSDKEAAEKAEAILQLVDRAGKLKMILLVETAEGLMELREAVQGTTRVIAVQFGAEDYTRDMEIARTKEGREVEVARQWIGIICRGCGIQAIDTPFTDYKDEIGHVADIENAKRAGMTAKTCIHPAQTSIVDLHMAPDEKEIQFAQEVIAESEKPENKLAGAFSLHGKMVDTPVIERARRVLECAQASR